MLKEEVLDTAGKAMEQTLLHLGLPVDSVRGGKYLRLSLPDSVTSYEDAYALAQEACERCLANPVMETYRIEIAASLPLSSLHSAAVHRDADAFDAAALRQPLTTP